MIQITNRFALPEAIVRAVRNDPYTRGESDFSITGLLRPPQLARLAAAHDLTEDVSDRIWALLGQAVHSVLERAAEGANAAAIFEERFFLDMDVDGRSYRVSGQIDHFETGCLTDYKITSVYAREGKVEWEQQLNLLRALMAESGHQVARLQNVLIFRDWRPKEALREDYPQSQVAALEIPMWPLEQALEFLRERIRLHVADAPRPCTDEERWMQPAKVALMKRGRKSAIKLFEAIPPEVRLGADQYWEERRGAFRRCEGYCPVSEVCPQWSAQRPAPDQPAAASEPEAA